MLFLAWWSEGKEGEKVEGKIFNPKSQSQEEQMLLVRVPVDAPGKGWGGRDGAQSLLGHRQRGEGCGLNEVSLVVCLQTTSYPPGLSEKVQVHFSHQL